MAGADLVFRMGRDQTLCGPCIHANWGANWGDLASSRLPVVCEACGRAVVILGRPDRRERHVACSIACLHEFRQQSRTVPVERRRCVVCGSRIETNRDRVTCSDRCRSAKNRAARGDA